MAMKEHISKLFRKGKLSRRKGSHAKEVMSNIGPKKKAFNKADGY